VTFGSLFSGAGFLDHGLGRAGWRCLWGCESDPDARRVLAHHRPGVPCHDDVRTLDPRTLHPVDLVCGGVPCTDWSVAGRRAGLAGKRSGLFFDFVRIADAVAARWLLFENVPGLYSHGGGADFATVLEHVTGARPEVPEGGWRDAGFGVGPKRSAAWRVCDSQHWGVPQRRRRIFLVADSRRGAGPLAVLFEPEGGSGNPAPRRPAGAGVARGAPGSARRTGGQRGGGQLTVANALTTGYGRGAGRDYEGDNALVTHSLNGGLTGGVPFVAEPIPLSPDAAGGRTGDAVTPSPDAEGRVRLRPPSLGVGEAGEPAGTVAAGGIPGVAYIPEDDDSWPLPDKATLDAIRGTPADAEPTVGLFQSNCGHRHWGRPDTPCPGCGGFGGTVSYPPPHGQLPDGVPWPPRAPVTAYVVNAAESCATRDHARESETARALDTKGGFAANQGGTVVGFQLHDGGPERRGLQAIPVDVAGPVDTRSKDGPIRNQGGMAMVSGVVVRRLLPVETLRLQGAPDDFLDLDPPLSDSAKYRLVGNGVTVPVAEWIGKRLLAVAEGRDPNGRAER
jgi:site-specific DNA-cytosine methylase